MLTQTLPGPLFVGQLAYGWLFRGQFPSVTSGSRILWMQPTNRLSDRFPGDYSRQFDLKIIPFACLHNPCVSQRHTSS
jgi:hypothetical protein